SGRRDSRQRRLLPPRRLGRAIVRSHRRRLFHDPGPAAASRPCRSACGWRAVRMSARTKLAGVTGWPLEQSLSPRIHSAWLREHGIDGAYVPLPIRREDFSRALLGLRQSGFAGVNVTVPHKEAAFALAHGLDDDARACGAVNLLLFREGAIEGRNTDAFGLHAS